MMLTPSELEDLSSLIDLLRRKDVASFECGGLRLILGAVTASESPGIEEVSEERVNPVTGLTPSQESEWFHNNE
jgi:hypothetical protein